MMDLQGVEKTGATGTIPDTVEQTLSSGQAPEGANDKSSLQATSGSTTGDGQGATAVDSTPVDLTRPTDEQILSYENQIRCEIPDLIAPRDHAILFS